MENHLDKVHWVYLSANPNAIHLLEKNLDKVDWSALSCNLNAISILEKNLDKVTWYMLSSNNNICDLICKYNYEEMRNSMKDFCEELVKKVFHPLRLQRICDHYGLEMTEYFDIM